MGAVVLLYSHQNLFIEQKKIDYVWIVLWGKV
ncbi:hypothetical protein AsAng_0046150 [Aureispira anguillae]|uniref:Uncharacterized protein n=1 Tax=Aureispira anguillae TaxID=2864201 RepID=A0A915YIR8_9BACT|nr:hypothetical protein AsAng_0046150 [Aureispira anguillae]